MLITKHPTSPGESSQCDWATPATLNQRGCGVTLNSVWRIGYANEDTSIRVPVNGSFDERWTITDVKCLFEPFRGLLCWIFLSKYIWSLRLKVRVMKYKVCKILIKFPFTCIFMHFVMTWWLVRCVTHGSRCVTLYLEPIGGPHTCFPRNVGRTTSASGINRANKGFATSVLECYCW